MTARTKNEEWFDLFLFLFYQLFVDEEKTKSYSERIRLTGKWSKSPILNVSLVNTFNTIFRSKRNTGLQIKKLNERVGVDGSTTNRHRIELPSTNNRKQNISISESFDKTKQEENKTADRNICLIDVKNLLIIFSSFYLRTKPVNYFSWWFLISWSISNVARRDHF